MKLIFFLLLTCTSVASAQGNLYAQSDTSKKDRNIFQKLGDDLVKSGDKGLSFLSIPFTSSLRDYGYFFAAGGATVGMMALDEHTTPWIKRELAFTRIGRYENVWNYFGERDYAVIGVGAAYLIGLTTGEDDLRRVARLCGESLLFSAVVTVGSKAFFGRARPSRGNPWHFRFFEDQDRHQSFPSGHSTIAFALSSVLAEEVDNVYFDIGIYSLASMTAIARIVEGRHWLSDVLAGAAIGTLTGLWVTSNDASTATSEPTVKIAPRMNGIGLQYRFR